MQQNVLKPGTSEDLKREGRDTGLGTPESVYLSFEVVCKFHPPERSTYGFCCNPRLESPPVAAGPWLPRADFARTDWCAKHYGGLSQTQNGWHGCPVANAVAGGP